MFGQNPIRRPDADPNSLAVQADFLTIQGEGPQSGKRALFVRLAGCNLACYFCDTEFESGIANNWHPATYARSLEERYSPQARELVVLTGGEPLRQAGASLLIAHLLASGTKLVQIETAGTLWLQGLERYIEQGLVQLVCSPKTPRINLNIAVYCQHWKYIIRAGERDIDGLPARGTSMTTRDKLQMLYRPASLRDPEAVLGTKHKQSDVIWVSPMDEQNAERNAANVQACVRAVLEHGYRLSLQTHKLVGVE